MKSLKDRYGEWALVTGASDGIGKAFAIELAKSGINLVLVARGADRLNRVSDHLVDTFAIETRILPADLATPEGVDSVLEIASTLDIGIFVPAAGYGTSGDFVDSAVKNELDMLDVNCRAVLKQTHYFARKFVERDRGAIILIASLVGFQGTPRAANYAATKAYIQSLAEGIRVELRSKNVDVLAVAPGPVKSGFAQRAHMEMGAADTPPAVAKQALASVGKRFTARPGFWGKLLGYSMALTPRWGRIQIMRVVMGGMTKHQRHTASGS